MKKITSVAARAAVGALGGMLLVGVAGVALAQAAEVGDDEVTVDVEIAEIEEPGVLALSVSGGSVALTEGGSTSTVRQFTGELPTVTVTDTRTADEIPDGAEWYVVGSATDFVGDAAQADIPAGHLGWTPHLIDGGESGGVAEGEQVDTVLDGGDDNVGLVDQELLASAWNSEDVATDGQWTANAALFLRTSATVAAGNYSSTITLSLFE